MGREFILTKIFDEDWNNLGLDDENLRELQQVLLNNPQAGAVIPGLSGGRKIRVALKGRGKSSGARVVYVDVVIKDKIYLLLAYPKNAQANLTNEQKAVINALITSIKEE